MTTTELVDRVISEAETVTQDAGKNFSRLSPEQINWKPAPESWSIGQVFDHIITSNSEYFLPLQRALRENADKKANGREFSSGLFGRLFLKQLAPESGSKIPAPKIFRPSISAIPPTIISDFTKHQDELIAFMRMARELDLNAIRISSPVNRLLRFKLGDALRILTTHERRHLAQAARVLQHTHFPKR